MNKNYDCVVFGASGFTGELVCEYIARSTSEKDSFKWAIAGRNFEKLQDVKRRLKIDVPTIVANSNDIDSLKKMAAETKVVITTVGPYLRYGESLVEACIAEKTHYCDLTGELPFIYNMVQKYHEKAAKRGVKIVHSCGFDSVPSDCGNLLLQTALEKAGKAPASQVRYYLMGAKGSFSRGTAESLMDVVSLAKGDANMRRVVANANSLTDLRPLYGKDQKKVIFDERRDFWTGPFLMESINTRIVRRTNALRSYAWGKDFDYTETTKLGEGAGAFLKGQAMRAGIGGFVAAALTKPTRKLVSKLLPEVGGGPSKEDRDNGFFKVELWGFTGRGDKKPVATAVFKGPKDPGYGSTAMMLAESGKTLARDEGPKCYGVGTPGAMLGLDLLDGLRKQGFQIEAKLS